MTNEELAAIEARAEAATPGIWVDLTNEDGFLMVMSAYEDICGFGDMEDTEAIDHLNATFVAAAREDVPALIAEIRRLQAEIERLTPKNKPLGIGRMYEDL